MNKKYNDETVQGMCNAVIEESRKNFEKNIQLDPVKEFDTQEWIERVQYPLGMDDEGELFWRNFTSLTRFSLIEKINNGEAVEFEIFSDVNSSLSQWYDSEFEDENGIRYHSAEQYMMAAKARLFEDSESLKEIMAELDIAKVKELGRQVQNFNQELYDSNKIQIIHKANQLKFEQNSKIREALLKTANYVIVEANPNDTVYTCGLKEDDENITYPDKWLGENILGFVLMDIRSGFTCKKEELK